MKIYFDTNILSRLTDLRISVATAQAFNAISSSQNLELVTSSKTSQEIKATQDPKRASALQMIYRLFDKVPITVAEYSGVLGGAPLGMCALGGSWTHPVLEQLRQIFDLDDAEHIFQAVLSQCDFFLTLDEATILARARLHSDSLQTVCNGMAFCSPIELASTLPTDA